MEKRIQSKPAVKKLLKADYQAYIYIQVYTVVWEVLNLIMILF